MVKKISFFLYFLISKDGRIPCGQKDLSSNAISKVFDGTRSGEPKAFQKEINITHVQENSSTTVRPMFFLP